MTTGFQIVNQGLQIDKDPEAILVYTFDWSQWLNTSATVTAVDYSLQVRANDPDPLIKVTSGISGGNKSFIKLSGGQVDKTYTVTAKVTTSDSLIDRRSFRVHVLNRSA